MLLALLNLNVISQVTKGGQMLLRHPVKKFCFRKRRNPPIHIYIFQTKCNHKITRYNFFIRGPWYIYIYIYMYWGEEISSPEAAELPALLCS